MTHKPGSDSADSAARERGKDKKIYHAQRLLPVFFGDLLWGVPVPATTREPARNDKFTHVFLVRSRLSFFPFSSPSLHTHPEHFSLSPPSPTTARYVILPHPLVIRTLTIRFIEIIPKLGQHRMVVMISFSFSQGSQLPLVL